MSSIYNPVVEYLESPGIARADPSTYKAFWPEVRGSYFFRHRRVYLDFLRNEKGKIFYLPDKPVLRPPFVLIGNWRDRSDITALWHIRARGNDKKRLVQGAAWECFNEGTERVITKLLDEREAAEFGQWGFETACRITLLERRLYTDPPRLPKKDDLKIVPYRKRALGDVLRVDTAAFDDFWRLDNETLKAIADSCISNVFLMAISGGEILGYAIGGANGILGYLQRLGVHAGHQGKGIGEALATGIIHCLYHLGASTVLVNTQEDNLTALRLYQSLGFVKTPERRFIMQYTARGAERGR